MQRSEQGGKALELSIVVGSTQPGDGSEVRRTDGHEVPFKERVVGVAQVTRGTVSLSELCAVYPRGGLR